jgi:hypothetical protein
LAYLGFDRDWPSASDLVKKIKDMGTGIELALD